MVVAIKVNELAEIKILGQLRYKNYSMGNEEYIDWLREPPDRIINHIVYTHHAYLKKEIPETEQLLFNILKTHGKNHQELIEIYILFCDLKIELENHMTKEEELIFPAMKLYESSKTIENRKHLLERIYEIGGEHKAVGDIVKKIRTVTNHFTLPMDDCRAIDLTYKKLAEIEKYIFLNIHLVKLFYLKTFKEFLEHEGFV